eukprot:CAMPEP_0119388958 /NCGR_PEP_ID=MMETSP1334-20130426/107181_1 /TAXON_ID=127549 /ORGANISM="Calcidiscus leptoporus, Strain RCC1130" /LENGTH=77 /DNA_ID=CAMNT_0007411085 /DNA_START=166 /DNA_END=395 /DNA_ORIENTATION=+
MESPTAAACATVASASSRIRRSSSDALCGSLAASTSLSETPTLFGSLAASLSVSWRVAAMRSSNSAPPEATQTQVIP